MSGATIGLVLDCADPSALAPFWKQALGLEELGAEGNYLLLVSRDATMPKLLLQRVSDPKTTKNRMHIDIDSDDLDADVARLEAIGARRIEGESRFEHSCRWVVMADPEGNEFCVCHKGVDADC